MKYVKRAMQCSVLSAALVITAVCASLSGNVTDTSQSSQQVAIVAMAESQVTTEETKEKVVLTTDPAWKNRVMVDVEEKAEIRQNPSNDSEVIGVLYKGAVADVVEIGEEWTKITSGNVEGYISNELCVYGDDAKALAETASPVYATSTVDGLCIRKGAGTDTRAISTLNEGEKALVNSAAEETEGWVAIEYLGDVAYVSAEYVKTAQDYGQAYTLEEEAKMLEEKELSVIVNVTQDDLELLAAIIYCEAGGECYKGQVAVGAVVLNRVESSRYPNTISEVIYQKGQFTPARSGKLSKVLANGKGSHCIEAAKAALKGEDPTNGALYFSAGRGNGLVIGNQTFRY